MSLWQGLLTSGLFLHPIKAMTSLPSLLSALRKTRGACKNKSNQDAYGGDDCYNLLEGRQIFFFFLEVEGRQINIHTSNIFFEGNISMK
uniref:Secreted protein n=1 Tax=Arundo donax TaxID=35708 RepID=A0A0A9EB38_ARUDO